jgi:hypothetical protein
MNVSESFLIYMCTTHEYCQPDTNITKPVLTFPTDNRLEDDASLCEVHLSNSDNKVNRTKVNNNFSKNENEG